MQNSSDFLIFRQSQVTIARSKPLSSQIIFFWREAAVEYFVN